MLLCLRTAPKRGLMLRRALAKINYQGFVNPFMHGHPTPEELSTAIAKSRDYLKKCHTKAIA